jgi:hypothetical protein
MFHRRYTHNDECGGQEAGESCEVAYFIGPLNGKAGQ